MMPESTVSSGASRTRPTWARPDRAGGSSSVNALPSGASVIANPAPAREHLEIEQPENVARPVQSPARGFGGE